MTREPDLEIVNRALSVTVQKQEREITRLLSFTRWVAEQAEAVATDGPLSILLAEIATRARLLMRGETA